MEVRLKLVFKENEHLGAHSAWKTHLFFKENEHEKRKALLSDNDVFCRCKVAQYEINGETAHAFQLRSVARHSFHKSACGGCSRAYNIENLASKSYETKARNMV